MVHRSDCAVHNEPAYPKGKCNCWWLISGEDVAIIRAALGDCTHEANYLNCEDWPPGSGCSGCRGDAARENAIHILDTGLHVTDAIPSDFEEEK